MQREKDKDMSKTYKITDGNAIKTAATLAEAADIAAEWYGFLADDGKVETVPDADLDASTLDSLNTSIGRWEARIAEAAGEKDFAGHGNYHVSAADRMGLRLVVREKINA